MGLKNLSGRHLDIIRRLIVGETAQEICLEMGLSPSRISILKADPLFASAYHEIEMRIADNFIESRASAMEILEDAAPHAARLTRDAILGSIDGEEVPQGLRLKSAWDCLDRTGNKAMEKHLVGHVDLGKLIGEAYSKKFGRDGSAVGKDCNIEDAESVGKDNAFAEGPPAPDDISSDISSDEDDFGVDHDDEGAFENVFGRGDSIPKDLSLMVVEDVEFGSFAPSTPSPEGNA